MMWFEYDLDCDYERSTSWLVGKEEYSWFKYNGNMYYVCDNVIMKAIHGDDLCGWYDEEVDQREAFEIIFNSDQLVDIDVWTLKDEENAKHLEALLGEYCFAQRKKGNTVIIGAHGGTVATFWDSNLFDKLPDGEQYMTKLSSIQRMEIVPGT